MKTRYQVIETKSVKIGKKLRTIFLEDESALAEVPQTLKDSMAIGSIAYTMAPWEFYHWTNEGWKNKDGTVVSS